MQKLRLEAHPSALFKTAYALRRDGQDVAHLLLRSRDEGVLTVGETPFALGSSRNHFVLLFEGVEVGRAVQPTVWRRRLEVQIDDAVLDRVEAHRDRLGAAFVLQAKNPFSRTFELFEDERRLGEIRRASMFSRKVEMDLPASLPLVVHGFLFALVAIQWRRADRQAASSG